MDGSTPELGQRYERAMIDAAETKSAALTAERLAKRVFSACYLAEEGTVAQREHSARTNPKFIAAEDDWLTKEHDANLAEARADAMKVRFESWRTENANRRAEMNLR